MRRYNKPGNRLVVCGCGGTECFYSVSGRDPELSKEGAMEVLKNKKQRLASHIKPFVDDSKRYAEKFQLK